MNKPQWKDVGVNFSGSNQAMANSQRGLISAVQGTEGLLDRLNREEQQKIAQQNKEIEQQRLANALALQQEEAANLKAYRDAQLKNQEASNTLARDVFNANLAKQQLNDYAASVVGRLGSVPYEQRQALLKDIQTKEGGFMPQGTTLTEFRNIMTPPKATANGTARDYKVSGNLAWVKTNFPNMAPEQALVVASSDALMKQAIDSQEKAGAKVKMDKKLADIRKAWDSKLSNKQIETAIDTYGDKAGKYLETQYNNNIQNLASLRSILTDAQNPGFFTDGLELTDLAKHEKDLPKEYTTEDGILAQAKRDPEFAANIKAILTNDTLGLDSTLGGNSREKQLAKYLKDYSKNK